MSFSERSWRLKLELLAAWSAVVVAAVAHDSALLLSTEALELVCDCSTEEAGVGEGFAGSATVPAEGIGEADKLAIGAVEAGYCDSQR